MTNEGSFFTHSCASAAAFSQSPLPPYAKLGGGGVASQRSGRTAGATPAPLHRPSIGIKDMVVLLERDRLSRNGPNDVKRRHARRAFLHPRLNTNLGVGQDRPVIVLLGIGLVASLERSRGTAISSSARCCVRHPDRERPTTTHLLLFGRHVPLVNPGTIAARRWQRTRLRVGRSNAASECGVPPARDVNVAENRCPTDQRYCNKWDSGGTVQDPTRTLDRGTYKQKRARNGGI